MRAKKILLLTSSLAPGGAETVVSQLATAMCAEGWEVSVVSMLTPSAFLEELTSAGVSVVSLGMRPRRLNTIGVLRFLSFLRKFQPDIIHSHMFHASVLGRIAHLLTGIPVVCTVHSEIECSHRKTSAGLREWIYRLTNAACARTTAVSAQIRERYIREKIVPSHCIQVIDNGIDADHFRPRSDQRVRDRDALGWQNVFAWLAVGRLELAKDYPGLIQAFRKVHQHSPQARLAIAGEGRCRPEIQRLINASGLSPVVSLLGLRTDIPNLMNACDALVMCSAWEGGPLVVLEAGASGRPVVATKVGIVPDAVLQGETGLVVPPRDPDALAHAMNDLMLLDPEALDRMGERARQHVMDQFSLRSTHHHYSRLYQEVLAVCL